MKVKDLIQFVEYTKSFKEPKAKRTTKSTDFDLKDLNITALLHHEIEKAEALKKLLADYEKANKKEEKKAEGWSMHHIAMFFMVTFPITGPLYAIWLRALLH